MSNDLTRLNNTAVDIFSARLVEYGVSTERARELVPTLLAVTMRATPQVANLLPAMVAAADNDPTGLVISEIIQNEDSLSYGPCRVYTQKEIDGFVRSVVDKPTRFCAVSFDLTQREGSDQGAIDIVTYCPGQHLDALKACLERSTYKIEVRAAKEVAHAIISVVK